MSKADLAEKLFRDGCNCAQAVACAFADECGLDEKTLFKISSSFGGGMGRLREVCGCVSGMFMVAGMVYAADKPEKSAKDAQYAIVQELANKFKAECGSIICRELLSLPPAVSESPVSEERTDKYYSKRPCVECVRIAALILEEKLSEKH